MTPIERKQDETLKEYKIRICSNKEELNLTWVDIADLVGKQTDTKLNESTVRKWFSAWKDGYDYAVENNVSESELDDKSEEDFFKEAVRYKDQKREYLNLLRNQARFEHLRDEIKLSILELENKKPLLFDDVKFSTTSDKTGLALWSDWHYGMEVDNVFNKYNNDIFHKRIDKLIAKTIEYGKQNNISKIIIANLGDFLSGQIHVSTRVQNNENIIKQVQVVSEVIAECVAELSKHFCEIEVLFVSGNHGRTISNKNDSTSKENFELLIPWYVESRLAKFKNVKVVYETDTFIEKEIDGSKCVFVHGNYDYVSNVTKNFPQVVGYVPDYIFMGNVHHNYDSENGRTTIICSSSLIGVDDYALTKRYYATPSQKFLIVNGEGIECTYNIKL